jgi:hypothetical protein
MWVNEAKNEVAEGLQTVAGMMAARKRFLLQFFARIMT